MDWLFVCEGTETEVHYLRGLGRLLEERTKNSARFDVRGTGRNTTHVVRAAEHMAQLAEDLTREIAYERVFTVFDKDDFSANAFNSAVTLSEQRGYVPLWSNESFELWLLLHYEYIDVHMHRDYVRRELANKMEREWGVRYQKNDAELFDKMMRGGKIFTAMKNARRLHAIKKGTPSKNVPCTTVYQLFDILKDEEGIDVARIWQDEKVPHTGR